MKFLNRSFFVVALLALAQLSYAGFWGSLFGDNNGNSSNAHSHHHKRQAVAAKKAATPNPEQATYDKYCDSVQTEYGYQIRCSMDNVGANEPVILPQNNMESFCLQQVYGDQTTPTPDEVDLSDNFIMSLKLCQGQISGPDLFSGVMIAESNNMIATTVKTITYYDVVCSGQESAFNPNIYKLEQAQYDTGQIDKVQQCVYEFKRQSNHGKILMIATFLLLALIAGLVVLFIKRKRKSNY